MLRSHVENEKMKKLENLHRKPKRGSLVVHKAAANVTAKRLIQFLSYRI